MLKTMQTDAVIQAVLKERSRHITTMPDASTIAGLGLAQERIECALSDEYPMRKRHLIEAAAYILAELERIQRCEDYAAELEAKRA